MALSSIRIFAGTLVPIAMCIRFMKMVVSENPPGGAWGATVAHRLYLFLLILSSPPRLAQYIESYAYIIWVISRFMLCAAKVF